MKKSRISEQKTTYPADSLSVEEVCHKMGVAEPTKRNQRWSVQRAHDPPPSAQPLSM